MIFLRPGSSFQQLGRLTLQSGFMVLDRPPLRRHQPCAGDGSIHLLVTSQFLSGAWQAHLAIWTFGSSSTSPSWTPALCWRRLDLSSGDLAVLAADWQACIAIWTCASSSPCASRTPALCWRRLRQAFVLELALSCYGLQAVISLCLVVLHDLLATWQFFSAAWQAHIAIWIHGS